MAVVRDAGDLGRVVREARKARGMTQAELAELAGVGVVYVGNLERGKETAELGKALRILRLLSVDLEATPRGGSDHRDRDGAGRGRHAAPMAAGSAPSAARKARELTDHEVRGIVERSYPKGIADSVGTAAQAAQVQRIADAVKRLYPNGFPESIEKAASQAAAIQDVLRRTGTLAAIERASLAYEPVRRAAERQSGDGSSPSDRVDDSTAEPDSRIHGDGVAP